MERVRIIFMAVFVALRFLYSGAINGHIPGCRHTFIGIFLPFLASEGTNDAVNLAMATGRIDPGLPWTRSNVVTALIQAIQRFSGTIERGAERGSYFTWT
jgi:hypothetical protein